MAPSCETVFQLLFAGQLHGKLEWFFQVPEGFSEKPEEVECLLQRVYKFLRILSTDLLKLCVGVSQLSLGLPDFDYVSQSFA